MALPKKSRHNYSRKWCIAYLKTLFGGRIAEEMFTGDVTTGATMDCGQATGVARRMVAEWGMNDRLGFVFYGDDENNPNAGLVPQKEYSEDTARQIDEEVKKLIDHLYDQTKALLQQNKD